MFPCILCSREFQRRDSRTRHLRCVHNTCHLCLQKLGDWNVHNCRLKSRNGHIIGSSELSKESYINSSDENSADHDEEDSNDFQGDDKISSESEGDEQEDSNVSDKDEEFSFHPNDGDSSDESDHEDIFSKDDEDLETDATITSSEDDEVEDEEEEETGVVNTYNGDYLNSNNAECEDSTEQDHEKDLICLHWPCNRYFLKSLWQKYGEGDFKIITHQSWLEDFAGKSEPRILRKVRRASESQFEAFCEIAKNVLAGNVYTLMSNRTFLLKNKNLIRGLISPNISLERKRKLVLERGANFIKTFVDLIEPVFRTLHTPSDE